MQKHVYLATVQSHFAASPRLRYREQKERLKTAADCDDPSRSAYVTVLRACGDETVSVVRLKKVIEESH